MATGLMRTRAGSVTAIMGFGQSVLAAVVGPLMGLGGNTAVVMSLGMSACIAIAAAGAVLATRGFTHSALLQSRRHAPASVGAAPWAAAQTRPIHGQCMDDRAVL